MFLCCVKSLKCITLSSKNKVSQGLRANREFMKQASTHEAKIPPQTHEQKIIAGDHLGPKIPNNIEQKSLVLELFTLLGSF